MIGQGWTHDSGKLNQHRSHALYLLSWGTSFLQRLLSWKEVMKCREPPYGDACLPAREGVQHGKSERGGGTGGDSGDMADTQGQEARLVSHLHQ